MSFRGKSWVLWLTFKTSPLFLTPEIHRGTFFGPISIFINQRWFNLAGMFYKMRKNLKKIWFSRKINKNFVTIEEYCAYDSSDLYILQDSSFQEKRPIVNKLKQKPEPAIRRNISSGRSLKLDVSLTGCACGRPTWTWPPDPENWLVLRITASR